MRSGYRVVWTAEAAHNLELIIDYLQANWTEKELKDFAKKLDTCIRLIRKRPHIFPVTKQRKNIRRLVLTKQTSIYNCVAKNTVEIITLFDTRQNPEKLKL